MRHSRYSAPGKLILMGEHAAVYGHPAMVTAIDLRLNVEMTETRGDGVELALPQLGYRGQTDWGRIVDTTTVARARWEEHFREGGDEGARYRLSHYDPDPLVQIALGEAARHLGEARGPGLRVQLDSQLPVGSGFGSSAALAVGVAAAYLDFMGAEVDQKALLDISMEVERRQHGAPSGVDNSAILTGGLLWASRDASGSLACEPIAPTSPLLGNFRVFHSGAPAEPTGVLVAAVRRRIHRARARILDVLTLIHDLTHEMRLLVTGGREEPGLILDLFRRAEAALEELGVVPKAIRRVIRKVEAAGGAAKISGAGALTGPGGGSVIVYHPDPDEIATWDFVSHWNPLRVSLGAEGLRREARA